METGEKKRPKDDQNFWNFWLLVLSAVLLVVEVWILAAFGKLPQTISVLDLSLIVLATFRIARLFVYSTIMQFMRDWFLMREVRYTADNKIDIVREKYQDGFRRAMSDLFSCAWCMGLQVAILVVFFYYLSPLSWVVILMFAVGGAATFIQVAANMLGRRSDYFRHETESKHPQEQKRAHDESCELCG